MPVSMPTQFSHKYTYTLDIYIWICEHNTCQNAAFCSPMCGDTGLHAANKFSFLSGQLHPASVAQSGASSVSWTRNGGYKRLLYIQMIETHAIALCPCTNRPNCDHDFWTILGSFRSRFPNFFGQCKQKIDGSLLCNAVFMPSVYDCIAYPQILAWRCGSRVSGPGDMFAWNESWVFWRDGVFHETICQINPKFLDKVCWTFGVTFQLYWELGNDIVSSPSIRWMHTANWKGDVICQTNTLADSCQIKTKESKKMLKN